MLADIVHSLVLHHFSVGSIYNPRECRKMYFTADKFFSQLCEVPSLGLPLFVFDGVQCSTQSSFDHWFPTNDATSYGTSTVLKQNFCDDG